jgi:hypothetical protein
MKIWLLPLAMAAVTCAGTAAAAEESSTVRVSVSGSTDAIVAYECDFTDGGNADGQVTPPWSARWPAKGVRCRFEHVVGRPSVTIDLRADGSHSTVLMSGRGSTVTLTAGRQPDGSW